MAISAQPAPVAAADVLPATDAATIHAILALDADHVSAAEVRDVLSRAPAPRIIALHGSIALTTMQPFAEFLMAMGYPAERLRDPKDGSLSHSSFVDSRKLAGTLAWYYEREGMVPLLIGHSQGGMVAIKVLHELAGNFDHTLEVWNPIDDRWEQRTTIIDPATHASRPILGLRVPYAVALATGILPRILLGQWSMLSKLRSIPDTVEEFTGFSIAWDPIAGDIPGTQAYGAAGTARVRNIALPAQTSHIALPRVAHLAEDATTRAWIENYVPDRGEPLPAISNVDTTNLLPAADIWYSVKRHWCLEAQRLILTAQAVRTPR